MKIVSPLLDAKDQPIWCGRLDVLGMLPIGVVVPGSFLELHAR